MNEEILSHIRKVWDENKNDWYFSVVDVVGILSGSTDVKQYIKKMRQRDLELRDNWGTICTPVEMVAKDGKLRFINCADTKGILRIIQSIPSRKAEPFKLWLAQVGSDILNEQKDPELSINRAMKNYLALGYSEKWINQRLKSIEIRKGLTDEWKRSGVEEGMEFSILTDEMMRIWSGKNIKEYKNFKGLKKENLRDNMTNLELVLNMLAETTTTEISKSENPDGFDESLDVARAGAEVAGNARKEIEQRTRKNVLSPKNKNDLLIEEDKGDLIGELKEDVEEVFEYE